MPNTLAGGICLTNLNCNSYHVELILLSQRGRLPKSGAHCLAPLPEMLTNTRAFCALSLLLIGTCFVSADIRLPKIFSDNMVLQRDAAVRIWGTADPGEELTISLGECNCPATADEEGRWSAELAPPETGGPYKLSVEGTESSVVFSEVYVGEVWVCVGESNMQRSLNQSLEFPDDAAREVWMQEIDNANIRLFTVPENVIDEPTVDFTEAVSWQKCRGKDVGDFSAVAYFCLVK